MSRRRFVSLVVLVVAAAAALIAVAAPATPSPTAARQLGPVTRVATCLLPLEASYPDPAPAAFSLGFGDFSEGARERPGFANPVAALWTGRLGKSGGNWVPGTAYAWVSHTHAEFTQRCRATDRRGAARLGAMRRWTGVGELLCSPPGRQLVLRVRSVQQGGRRIGTHLSVVVRRTGRVIAVARVLRTGATLSYTAGLCRASSIP